MDSIVQYFASQGLDFWQIITYCGILLAGTLVITLLSKLVFGRNSLINCAFSSYIGILFIYTLEIVFHAFPNSLSVYLPELPFTSVSGHTLSLFQFANAGYALVCSQILSMIILAFIMNLIDRWMPGGKNILTWLFFRIISIVCAITIHGLIIRLFRGIMPEGIVTYAPTVLLAILILMVLTGALKIIVGALMATVNPFIGALYTFFFANIVGKQITRAVLTTGILAGLILILQKFGISSVNIAPAALIAYIPFAIALIIMWKIVHINK